MIRLPLRRSIWLWLVLITWTDVDRYAFLDLVGRLILRLVTLLLLGLVPTRSRYVRPRFLCLLFLFLGMHQLQVLELNLDHFVDLTAEFLLEDWLDLFSDEVRIVLLPVVVGLITIHPGVVVICLEFVELPDCLGRSNLHYGVLLFLGLLDFLLFITRFLLVIFGFLLNFGYWSLNDVVPGFEVLNAWELALVEALALQRLGLARRTASCWDHPPVD